MTVKVSVTVTQVSDGSEGPVDGELAAALAGPGCSSSPGCSPGRRGGRPGRLDHGEREESGRGVRAGAAAAGAGGHLRRRLRAREERAARRLPAPTGIRHGTVEKGHERGVVSIFGPGSGHPAGLPQHREANLYPADARWVLPQDPYSMGMRALVAYHLAEGGYGQAQEVIGARTGVTVGRAQLAGIAGDLAGLGG